MAQTYLDRFRKDPLLALDLAALAANEGSKEESVRTLQQEFDKFPLVEYFHPHLPWFRTLAGDAAYDRLMAERKQRIARAHAEMLQLETQAAGTALQLP